MTGKSTAGERQRCIEAGANDYVPKPVDAAELLARSALAASQVRTGRPMPGRCDRARRGRADGQEAPPVPREPLEASAIAGMKILVVDDDFRNIFAMSALLERGHATSSSPRAARKPSTCSSGRPTSTSS